MKKVVKCLVIFALIVLGMSQKTNPVLGAENNLKPLELDGTEWKITLTSQQGKAENDTLVFKDKKFISVNFDKQKYEPTNYTLSLKDDGTTVFETMQTKGDDVVFWHGIVQDQSLRGVLSVHARGQVNDFSLNGSLVSGVLKLQEATPTPKIEEPSVAQESTSSPGE